jgi:endoglucanase
VRWQLVRGAKDDPSPKAYDAWLESSLAKLDQGLAWAKENGVMVVVDLHSPPGGSESAGGYQDAGRNFFASPSAQARFIQAWREMAARYKGNAQIWGFDLVNEPMDSGVTEDCLDWNALALEAGKAIREIDPDRTLIVEPATGGGAEGFDSLIPLPLDRVVYSFHMYEPGDFTHQGVYSPIGPVYPGIIEGKKWDRAALKEAMKPAIDFTARYRVQLYVGEFSAARWAKGADRYLDDLVSIFEEEGWDWSYHAFREWDGWSLEHGSDPANHAREKSPGPRLQVMLRAFAKNRE